MGLVALPVNAAQTAGTADASKLLLLEGGLAPAALVSLWALWASDVIRPGSFRRRGARETGEVEWWVWGLCGAASFLLGNIGGALALAFMRQRPHTPLELMAVGGTVAGVCGIAASVWLLRTAGAGRRAPEGLLLRPSPRALRQGLLGLLASFPVVQTVSVAVVLLLILAGREPPGTLAHETLKLLAENRGAPAAWVVIFGAVVLAPISEELVFRVFFQTMLLRLTRSPWAAVLGTSVLFSLVHLLGGIALEDAHALAPLFALSVAMGIAYERTKRPLVPIIMHMGFNAVNVVLAAAVA